MNSFSKIAKSNGRVGTVVLALLLAACGGSAEKPADSLAAVPAPAPAAETPPSSETNANGITEYGYGALRAGMTYTDANAALKGALKTSARPELEGCDYVTWEGGPAGLRIMVVENKIARVETSDTTILSGAGARVGDTEDRINSLYPGRVTVMPHKYTDGHYLVVKSANAADTLNLLVFETDKNKVTTFRGGVKPAVEYVEGCS